MHYNLFGRESHPLLQFFFNASLRSSAWHGNLNEGNTNKHSGTWHRTRLILNRKRTPISQDKTRSRTSVAWTWVGYEMSDREALFTSYITCIGLNDQSLSIWKYPNNTGLWFIMNHCCHERKHACRLSIFLRNAFMFILSVPPPPSSESWYLS